ncbi:ribosome maturation factor RimP [Helicobacter sp.]|uniref:ribosome maturation factor RimP n=1 Tax=Helicobacter sp. TaxID=218 RepID=UPI0025C6D2D2|nr:ribosome maturation factor RimP [Helicobacter sp.]MCI5633627.1 ribosome maturation factor RimP [Helicobacter sp.]MDY5557147.1 ribosome maturation factor RimP [Helicobacter sp.]
MTLTPELESKIKILVESLGFGLYEILNIKENENQILRICITKATGSVNLDDCQEVSLAISPLLDVEIPESQKYFLEVSSPGIERNLKNLEHYKGAINELVKIKTMDKKEFKGKLLSVDAAQIALEGGIVIPLNAIKKAQTYFQW